jgi:hypothetical protein
MRPEFPESCSEGVEDAQHLSIASLDIILGVFDEKPDASKSLISLESAWTGFSTSNF